MPSLPRLIADLPARLLPADVDPADLGVDLRPAAVLILLFPRGDDVRFLLTARPHTLALHAGQISLPGGRLETSDGSLWEAAQREAREELGLRTGRLSLLGRLDPTHVTVSQHLIWPFVAWNPVVPRLDPSPDEVEAVVEVSLAALLDPATVQDEEWEFRGATWSVTLYRFGDVAVWGATARVLSDLTARMRPDLIADGRRPGDVLQVMS